MSRSVARAVEDVAKTYALMVASNSEELFRIAKQHSVWKGRGALVLVFASVTEAINRGSGTLPLEYCRKKDYDVPEKYIRTMLAEYNLDQEFVFIVAIHDDMFGFRIAKTDFHAVECAPPSSVSTYTEGRSGAVELGTVPTLQCANCDIQLLRPNAQHSCPLCRLAVYCSQDCRLADETHVAICTGVIQTGIL